MIGKILTIGVIVVFLWIIFYLSNKLRWGLKCRLAYKKLKELYGEPQYINKNPKGTAVWTEFTNDCPYVRIILMDNNDGCTVYSTIHYEIDSEKLDDVLSATPSLYDKLSRKLTIHSSSLECNMVWLCLIHDLCKDAINENELENIVKKRMETMYSDAKKNTTTLQNIKNEFNLHYQI